MDFEKNFKKALDSITELDLEYDKRLKERVQTEIDILEFLYWHVGTQEGAAAVREIDPAIFSADNSPVAMAWINYMASIGKSRPASRTGFTDFLKASGWAGKTDFAKRPIDEIGIDGIEGARKAIAGLRTLSTWIAKCDVLASELMNGTNGLNAFSPNDKIAREIADAEKSALPNGAINAEKAAGLFEKIARMAVGEKDARIDFGFANLDRYSGGMYRGGINVVLARPGERKTTFLTNVVSNHLIKQSGNSIVFISAEMPKDRIFFRIAMALSGHGSHFTSDYLHPLDFQDGNRIRPLFVKITEMLKKTSLTIIDSTDLDMDIAPIITFLDKLCIKNGAPDLIMIDYFQLIGNPALANRPKHENLSDISQQLTRFANRHPKTALLVLAQARRSGTQTAPNQAKAYPDLDSVADSDRIARDAWMVISLSRIRNHDTGDSNDGAYGLEILKNREGALGYEPLKVLEAQQKILECDEFRRDRPPEWQKGAKSKALKV